MNWCMSRWGRGVVALGVMTLCGSALVRADAFAQVYDSYASVLLTGSVPNLTVAWNDDPANWDLVAGGQVDHTTSSSNSASDAESFDPFGDGFVIAGPVSVPGMASVDSVQSAVESNGVTMFMGEIGQTAPPAGIYASALSSTPAQGNAYGTSSIVNSFTVTPGSPELAAGGLKINVDGLINLAGAAGAGESYFADYRLEVIVRDPDLPAGSDEIFKHVFTNKVEGEDGSDMLSDTLQLDPGDDVIFVTIDKTYELIVNFDTHAQAITPEPASMLCLLAGAFFLRRR